MKQGIYLDYAAGTPVDPRVFEAMRPYFSEKFGNPGSLHSFGQEAIAAIDRSRETIAKAIGADFREIIFTGSATEANNLALRGVVRAASEQKTQVKNPKIIISAIEHESVLETARDLEREGVDVTYLSVDQNGVVDLARLKEALDEQVVLVSIMHANNEVGTTQPIEEIAKIIKSFRGERQFPVFHTDAAQSFQFLDCSVKDLGIDLMTLSSHKIYGPKGAGALYIKDKTLLKALTTGGGQEFGLRSGTENVPPVVGFAKAVELIIATRAQENERIAELAKQFLEGIKKISPQVEENGFQDGFNEKQRLPNILNIYFPGHPAQELLTAFDLRGLAASSGSACRSRALEVSYVLEAMGHSHKRATESIRFSLGRPTTKEEIEGAVDIIKDIVYK